MESGVVVPECTAETRVEIGVERVAWSVGVRGVW
jgi:hypothetical protein